VALGVRRRQAEAGGGPEARWAELGELEEYRALCRGRLDHLVEVRQPLVLISQIQRSGGTLLNQLFDGHPECHVDPYELKIGYPKKHRWPVLDLTDPEGWFERLYFPGMAERLRRTSRTRRPGVGRSVFPFLFLPRLQKAIFDRCVAARSITSERDVLDCYFTAYFNAWLDNHNLYSGPKRVVVGFAPRLAMDPENVERLFAAYPDGRLISIVRDPRAWYISAARHMPHHYGDVDTALDLWRRSTDAALAALDRYGERVILLAYEQLVLDPEATLKLISDRIAITMSAQLLEPTFNGRPMQANSSEAVGRYGILPERVDAYRGVLDPEASARIAELVGDRYLRAVDASIGPARLPER
jgi:hypothetical protein